MSRGGVGGGSNVSGKIAGLYDLEETLGSGHFAVVKMARHVFTGEKVAVKVIDKTKLDQVSRAHLFQEVRCMKLVQHPNVVRLYEVIDTQTKLYLILELGDGGDLYDYIMRHDSGLSEDVAREYFKQIVTAISYCHRLHVVHRDLKPENVVFFQKLGLVKLTDFGFSNKFCPGQKLETSCGSLAYSAPEILLGDSYDAPAVDVWSLGVILYMLVCGHAPFHEANDSETLTMIMDCKYTIPPHVSKECKALIGRMLVRQPERRATLLQISCDPWVTNNKGGEQGDTQVDGALPLVCGLKLCEEEHSSVIQKMVTGKIATKEQIMEALHNDEYNHITATYYLLAERMLRSHREDEEIPRRPEALDMAPPPMGTPTPPRAHLHNTGGSRTLLAPPSNNTTLLTVPRTPTDVPQRGRKCSIVREGEEEEEEDGSGGVNRRGSRSEGRLHLLTLHNASASPAAQRNKMHHGTNLTSGVHKVTSEDENMRMRLGNSGMGTTTTWMSSMGVGKKAASLGDGCRPKSAIEGGVNNNIPRIVVKTSSKLDGGGTTNSGLPLLCENDTLTSSITQAATITIPVRGTIGLSGEGDEAMFRSMPSPFRPLKHSLDDSVLVSGGVIAESKSVRKDGLPYQQPRRNKYSKSHRTTSCSSSDASDEDSESRKKRSHKQVNTPTHKESVKQRRDSHDDSSDSQEQGAVGSRGGDRGGGGQATTGGSAGGQGQGGEDRSSGGNSGGGGGGTNLSRRHRMGRRAGETRLRESQSLNRITEVQEAVDTVVPPQPIQPTPPHRQRGFLNPTKIFNRRPAPPLPPNTLDVRVSCDENKIPHVEYIASPLKAKSRLYEKENCHKGNTTATNNNNVVVEKPSFKKMRLLGRYLQVHKKLCLPRWPGLPGLLGGGGRAGRLYKAQSCGSIVRDKITSAGASSLLLVNELCKEKPIVLETHRAHIKLLADMRNGRPHPEPGPLPVEDFSMCRIHLGDVSKCCGMC